MSLIQKNKGKLTLIGISLLFFIPIICFSQSSEDDKYEILDYMIFKNKVEQKMCPCRLSGSC